MLAGFPLHVIPEFGETFRPSGHYATWLPQLAQEFKHFPELDAHWIVLNDRITTAREIRWQNQTFHVLPAPPTGRASTLFRADRKRIRQTLDGIRPDLVHGWGTEDVYGLAAVTSGYPSLVSMQGILTDYVLKCRMHPRDYFQALLEFYVLWRAHRITVESEWGRQCLHRRNPRARMSLVEYGVQPEFFDAVWSPDPLRPAAIFVGGLVPRKGIQDLVAAFRSPSLAGAELWVVGDGPGRWVENLRRQAPSNIIWLGRKTILETAALLGRAWCLVLPTRADTCPNVVKEARVIGLPVITTPCGGQVSYIEHDRNGFLVRPGEVERLSGYLGRLLGDLVLAKSMGACKQEEQRAWFRPKNTATALLKVFQEMTAL